MKWRLVSVKAVAWALEQKVGNAAAKLVLVGIAEYANPDTWVAWPGRQTVSTISETSGRTVTRHVQLLVELGLIAEVRFVDLEASDMERFEAIPVSYRPRLWHVNPTRQPVTPRVDKNDEQGRQNGHSRVDTAMSTKPRTKPLRKGGVSERRDWLDAEATAAMLDKEIDDVVDPAAALKKARSK